MVCGHDQERLDWSRDEIGSIYEWKRLFSRRRGVIISGGRQLEILFSNGRKETLTRDKLAKAQKVLDLSAVPSVAFRFEVVGDREEKLGRATRDWIEAEDGLASFIQSVNDQRLYARSAISAGKDSGAVVGLSESELRWLLMHAKSAGEAHVDAAREALNLPPGRYPDKVIILLQCLAESDWEPDESQLARIAEIPQGLVVGTALLRAAVGLDADPEKVLSDLLAITEVESNDINVLGSILEGDVRALDGGDQSIPVSLEEKLIAARHGASIRLDPDEVQHLHTIAPDALDDVIEESRIEIQGGPTQLSLVLRARLDPEGLTEEELTKVGHSWELARRQYRSGAVSGTDDADPAADHYRSLEALRGGDTSAASSLIDPTGVLGAVVESLNSGKPTPQALSDPSTWPVFGKAISPDDTHGLPLNDRWLIDLAHSALFSWNFDFAAQYAKEALRVSESEEVRDEALNLIAFHHYQEGRDELAVAALEKALAGQYTASLQSNAGIVAEHMDPETAAHHLGQLAAEAPTSELKLAAVRRAFHVWDSSRPVWEDEAEDIQLPPDLMAAMRALAVEETPVDDHREIMRLLAVFDSDWASNAENTASSPHSDAWDHKLYIARAAHDPHDYIEALASAVMARPDEPWLLEERDSFLDGMRNLIFSDVENVGPAAYAYAAIDSGLPMRPFDQIALTCGALIGICRALTADEKEPSDEVYQKYRDAKGLLPTIEADAQEVLLPIVEVAGNTYATSVGVSREAMLKEGTAFLDRVGSQLVGVPMRRINWTAVRDGMRPLKELAEVSITALARAKREATSEELIQAIDDLIGNFRTLSGLASNPRNLFK
jgi:hypothetical protein